MSSKTASKEDLNNIICQPKNTAISKEPTKEDKKNLKEKRMDPVADSFLPSNFLGESTHKKSFDEVKGVSHEKKLEKNSMEFFPTNNKNEENNSISSQNKPKKEKKQKKEVVNENERKKMKEDSHKGNFFYIFLLSIHI